MLISSVSSGCRHGVSEVKNITIVEGDLLDQQTEAIVNTWNRDVIRWWLAIPNGAESNDDTDVRFGAVWLQSGQACDLYSKGSGTRQLRHLTVFAAILCSLPYQFLQRAFHACSVRPWFLFVLVTMAFERPASL